MDPNAGVENTRLENDRPNFSGGICRPENDGSNSNGTKWRTRNKWIL